MTSSSTMKRWVDTVVKCALVEPILFLFSGAISLYFVVFTTALYRKVCLLEFANNPDVRCDRLSDTPWAEDKVQSLTATWHIYTGLAHLIPIMIVGPIFGSFSDANGRKIPILIGTSGLMLLVTAVMVEFNYVELPIIWIPISIAITALSGSFSIVYPACYSYLSDRLTVENSVTIRFTIAHMASQVGSIIFGFLGSLMISKTGFIYTLLLCQVLLFSSFLLSLCRLSQTPGKAQKKHEPLITNEEDLDEETSSDQPITTVLTDEIVIISPISIKSLLAGICHTITRSREGHFRGYILALIFTFSILTTVNIGFGSILSLYQLRAPLSWTPAQIATYSGVSSLISIFGLGLGVLVMKIWKFHETTAVLISMGSIFAKTLITGFSETSWLMYVAAFSGVASGICQPVTQSLISQLVAKEEIGKIYAVFQIAMDLSILISNIVVNLAYSATLHLQNGFLMWVLSGCLVIPILAFLWVHVDYKKYRNKGTLSTAYISD